MTPTITTYCRKYYSKDEKGNFILDENKQKIIIKRIYDGKVISISSPRAKEGKFYELYNTDDQVSHRLVCRLPTWDVNPTHTRNSLRQAFSTMNESEFMMEFGAEFSGTGMENFFAEEEVNLCFNGNNLINREMGEPGKIYFIHLDPATSSHNYAVVVLHKEYFMDVATRKSNFLIIVDHIKYWQPFNNPIPIAEVDEYVIQLKRKFKIGLVTYDQFNSSESVLKLRKAGIPNKETRFTRKYKNAIYRELENLVNAKRIKIPYDNLLKNEMLELQRRWDGTGFKVFPKKEGDGVKTDDVVDALAGAAYSALQQQANRLPSSITVDTGITSQSNDIAWKNMQGGIYGYGTGQQVAAALEKRSSWPSYKR